MHAAVACVVALAAAGGRLTLQADGGDQSTLQTDASGNLHINTSVAGTIYLNGVDVLARLSDCLAMREELNSITAAVFSPPSPPPPQSRKGNM